MVTFEKFTGDDDVSRLERLLRESKINRTGHEYNNPEDLGLVKIADGSHRNVYKHPEIDGYVVKTSNTTTAWSNQNEIEVFTKGTKHNGQFEVPDPVLNYLAPVVAFDDSTDRPMWLIMEEAETDGIEKKHGRKVWKMLKDHGWGIEDMHMDNIGLINGNPVAIDYEYLSPIETMLPRPKRRVESGSRWE